jgi:hypothetical protein
VREHDHERERNRERDLRHDDRSPHTPKPEAASAGGSFAQTRAEPPCHLIGIRSALGADPRRVLRAIFGRASAQLGTGVLAGLIVAATLDRAAGGGIMGGRAVILLPIVAALTVTVGLLAAPGPARRGLAVQPTEALREE